MKKLMFFIIFCFGFIFISKADKVTGKPLSVTHSVVNGKESLFIVVEEKNGQKYTVEMFFDKEDEKTIYLRQKMVVKIQACINQACQSKKIATITFPDGILFEKHTFTPAGSYILDGETLNFW